MANLQNYRDFRLLIANPAPAAERIQFSFMTPRALPVLAAVTPSDGYVQSIRLVDQTIEDFPFDELLEGDLVGISIHTFNTVYGYRLAREARQRGAKVVFGGPHASIFPEEGLRFGDAVVTGDGEMVWSQLLHDYARRQLRPVYKGGRVSSDQFVPARWDLMGLDRYLIASIQTVRGCPKQCSFCSVWVQDGRLPRVRANQEIIEEVDYLYRAGFRLVMFADDNFYPYTLADIENARSAEERQRLQKGREDRLALLDSLASAVPPNMFFCTQITMEVADDPEYLQAMKRARVAGALIGIETITEAGLKATRKDFNATGRSLLEKLEKIRTVGFPYIMGSFIFGIESDTRDSLDETIRFARDCGIALSQFIPMTPLPGTVDFALMKKGKKTLKFYDPDYDYWLDQHHPRILFHHPHLKEIEILDQVDNAWNDFYSFSAILQRSRRLGLLPDYRRFLTYLVICRGLLVRYRRYGLSADSAVRGTKRKLATLLGRVALYLMKGESTLVQPKTEG